MKRFFLIVIALLFCIGMSVPAMAAEPQEYIFEIMPPISLFDGFDFVVDDDMAFYEGLIPEGLYDVYIYEDDSLILASLSPISVEYSLQEIESIELLLSSSFVTFDDGVTYSCLLLDLVDMYGFTTFELASFDGEAQYIGTSVKLVSVEEATLPSAEIADIIHADLFGSFLICGTLIGLALFRGNRHV